MQKTLLKFLSFELIERIARFENLLTELSIEADTSAQGIIHGLQGRLSHLKRRLTEEKTFFLKLFSEKTVREKEREFQQIHLQLERAIYQPYQELSKLSQWLLQITRYAAPVETSFFLKDVLPDEFVSEALGADFRWRSIIFRAEMPEQDELGNILPHHTLIERLPLLQKNSPLGWAPLIQSFSERLYHRTSTLRELRSKIHGFAGDEALFQQLCCHLISLRLLGPAYYYAAIAEALLMQDHLFLQKIEPILFYGINHFNFIDKNLVIIHEATERSTELIKPRNPEESDKTTESNKVLYKATPNNGVAEMMRIIERLIAHRFAFTEKHFKRALALQPKLMDGALLSSSQRYAPEDVSEQLADFLASTHKHMGQENPSIYDVLSLVTETPNYPREIMNAGWIHKVDRISARLYSVLTDEDPGNSELKGFDRFRIMQDQQDHLLLKSIETAEIHRVLLCSPT